MTPPDNSAWKRMKYRYPRICTRSPVVGVLVIDYLRMKQCMVIHWGRVFATDEAFYEYLRQHPLDPYHPDRVNRRDWLGHALGVWWEVFIPKMPSPLHATYTWRTIRFEKYLPVIQWEHIVLIWNSLWWSFLCKWLSENTFPKKINQLHLVATPITKATLGDFLWDLTLLPHLETQCDEIYLYHSRDDDAVPYTQSELLKKHLPTAKFLTFDTRGHFYEPTFPELLENMGV